ncbi:MAG: helix-turn-helix transcriptional regulator [Oscillospiraceae bacterium]
MGEYIRYRRLTLAAQELCSTDAKVIDVAAKYGYNSPDGFSRAFQRFHGVPPPPQKGWG